MNESWDTAGPAVAARGVTKTYANGVRAVRGVDLDVPAGEIRAVVGENGAGKSTLMKLFYGLEQPTSGEILVGGRPRVLRGPASAIALGVGMVHQNLMLVPSFTVAQNVVLGVEPGRRGLVDARAAAEATARLAEEAGLAVDPLARIDEVSVGMRQRAEILKALHRRARVLILDEPTAVLTPQETEDLFAAVRRLRDGGMTVLFISHKLREVREISDRVSVMRAGALVGTVDTAGTSEHALAAMMVGREMTLDVARAPAWRGATTLSGASPTRPRPDSPCTASTSTSPPGRSSAWPASRATARANSPRSSPGCGGPGRAPSTSATPTPPVSTWPATAGPASDTSPRTGCTTGPRSTSPSPTTSSSTDTTARPSPATDCSARPPCAPTPSG
jgi:ABC-type multidrug transport system ATPase subunit